MPRRRRDDNGDWIYGELDGTHIRWKVHPERARHLRDDDRSLLAQEARDQGMTLLEYIGRVGRMTQPELYVYRDQIAAGNVGAHQISVYDAWVRARSTVWELQILSHGVRPGDPDFWL